MFYLFSINIYDMKQDKMKYIHPYMLGTVVSGQVKHTVQLLWFVDNQLNNSIFQVTHVEWNPNESTKDFFLYPFLVFKCV